jgi:hypothetical protein
MTDAPPTINSVTPNNLVLTTMQFFAVRADISDDVALQSAVILMDGTAQKTCPVSGRRASCQLWGPPLSLGVHVFTVAVTDAASQTVTSAPVMVSVENATPIVRLISPADGTRFATSDRISVLASALDDENVAALVILVDGEPKKTCPSTETFVYCQLELTLQTGSHTIATSATDNSGKSALTAPIAIQITERPAMLPPVFRFLRALLINAR